MSTSELNTHDFYYDLPEELIAQTPIEKRDESRLLVMDRASQTIEHKHFYDIYSYLNPGDVLVINDSRVMPARIFGKKVNKTEQSEPAAVETVLLKQRELDLWETIVRPGKRLKVGAVIDYSSILTGVIESVTDEGNRLIRFSYDKSKYESIFNVLDIIGKMPLPPYITAQLQDNDRYQTVYADKVGSAAAPTAGLHFTNELLKKIEDKGVKIVRVMLNVGLGTFRPVKVEKITEHVMHSEYFEISKESAEAINTARANGGRIISVGTTSTRVLESCSTDDGVVHPFAGDTSIFIYPGYKFKAVDALITNFHLPESTLVMLVSAFAGKDYVMQAYTEAIAQRYRFFSFGDAMFIQ